jgi:fructose-bisphosphate aldolase class 1
LSEKLGVAIIEYIKLKKIENVIVYQREFYGYEGDEPTLEIVIPEKGAVVFGKIDVEKGLKLVDKYVINTSEIIDFLVDNNGTKKCNHNH